MKRSINQFIGELEQELNRLLVFWSEKVIDLSNDGFFGAINSNGQIQKEANKGAILNARILWSFSAGYLYTKNERFLKMADRAFAYLKEYFIDSKNGGVYWEVDARGLPLNTRKQAYAQGFAIYGLTEYYRASGKEEALELAKSIYRLIEMHFWDNHFEGYIESLNEEWQPLEDMRLSAKEENWPKSMNTHLHILEPYTNLYRCWPNQELGKSIHKIIRLFLDRIIDKPSAHFHLLFDYDWTVKTAITSYGHDIEGSWLLYEAAEVLGEEQLIGEVKKLAITMVDVTYQEGTSENGSLFYEKEGHLIDEDRHWWPQAEAMVGYINAWQLNGKQLYLNEAEKVWEFIARFLIDRENGEWFWRVDKNGNPYFEEQKVGFWKCPYHNTRALIEVCKRLKSI